MTQNSFYDWIERWLNSRRAKEFALELSELTVSDQIITSELRADTIQGTLEQLSLINTKLGWEYDTLADVPNWYSNNGGVSNWTYNITGNPRRIHAEHDGSGGSDDIGGIKSNTIVSYESIGGFRVIYEDVSFTHNADDNGFAIGLSDVETDTWSSDSGNGFVVKTLGANDSLDVVTSGSATNTELSQNIDWTTNHDITLEYDGYEVRALIDGVQRASTAYSTNTNFQPLFQIRADASNSNGEIVEIGHVTVKPLPGVLQ